MKRFLISLAITLTLVISGAAFAQRGGGGGFSSGGSRSSSAGSSSRSSGASSSRSSGGFSSGTTRSTGSTTGSSASSSSGGFSSGTSRSTGSSGSGSSGVRPANSTSSVDKATAQKAAQQGTVFKDREAAVGRFQSDKAASYSNKFDREPAQRPQWVPQTYVLSGGMSVNIGYVPWLHGYGYWDPMANAWMTYNIMQDEAMMAQMMAQEGYLVQDPTMRSFGAGAYIFSGLVVLVVLVIFGAVLFGRRY